MTPTTPPRLGAHQVAILERLADQGAHEHPVTLYWRDVAEGMGVSRASVSSSTRALTNRGFIKSLRKPDGSNLVALTTAGLQAADNHILTTNTPPQRNPALARHQATRAIPTGRASITLTTHLPPDLIPTWRRLTATQRGDLITEALEGGKP